MTKHKNADAVPLVQTHVYQARGVTYVPHYRNDSIFVGPGYPRLNQTRWTAEELVVAGATKAVLMLHHRGKFGAVDELNP